MQGITAWMRNWKRRGWRTADNKPVKNEDLWRALDEAASRHNVKWHWVRGHADDPLNNRVDALAVAAMQPFRKGRARRGTLARSAAGGTGTLTVSTEASRLLAITRKQPKTPLQERCGADAPFRAKGTGPRPCGERAHRDLSRFSAPEMSALPGPSSMLIAVTIPSSTTME